MTVEVVHTRVTLNFDVVGTCQPDSITVLQQIPHISFNDVVDLTCLVKIIKVLPYSLPNVGLGADPGVQAVSPQVTFSSPDSRLPLLSTFSPGLQSPSHPKNVTVLPSSTELYCLMT